MSRELTVASGRFTPGHLGELTQTVPFDLVDALLDETRCVQRRLRDLPSRVGVYFVLAMCLFPKVGYQLVWSKLTAALTGGGLEVAEPTAKALRDLRRRIGTEPMRRLFEVLAGPLARPADDSWSPVRAVSNGLLRRLQLYQDPRYRAQCGVVRSRQSWRASDARADDPGGDRHPGSDRRRVRPHQRRRDLRVTWWSDPIDQAVENGGAGVNDNFLPRIDPVTFGARSIVPLSYAAFAFLLGVTLGIVIRRTVPAMATTLAAFTRVQIAMPLWIRPHLAPATTITVPFTADTPANYGIDSVSQVDIGEPCAWVITE